MTIDRRVIAAVVVFALAACTRVPQTPAAHADATPSSTPITAGAWTLPVDAAQQPDLAVAPDGSLLLSWIEGDRDAMRLRVARWRHGAWSAPTLIAEGTGLGNGADTPHVRQTADGALWATWLRKIGEGHARDVVLARSVDDGRTWSTPVAVNTDGTATEHGFASLWPEARDALGVAWLDGRETAGNVHGHDMHAMHAMPTAEPMHATMLRSAVFDADLVRRDESAVDTATCDCCQTDVAVLDDGPRLVYRDRAPGEIRDISLLTRVGRVWSAPRRVHADGWRMDGCPVNGPALAGRGRALDVAWYTEAGGTPTVRFATSRDGGATFESTIDLAATPSVLGRIDVAHGRQAAWVAWLEQAGDAQALKLARVDADDARHTVQDVAKVGGSGRGTGWPRLAIADGALHAVWIDVVDGQSHLRGWRTPDR